MEREHGGSPRQHAEPKRKDTLTLARGEVRGQYETGLFSKG